MPHLEAVNTPPARADVWNVSNAHCRVHYQLLAEAEPDLLCRALNLFALQFLTPQQVNVQRMDDLLSIDIVMDGLSWHRAQVIAEKLRNLISVCSVNLQAADCAWGEPVQAAGKKNPEKTRHVLVR
ncbi:hypothetical protein ACYZT2_27530 [Pseudomonas sp. MDT1-85]